MASIPIECRSFGVLVEIASVYQTNWIYCYNNRDRYPTAPGANTVATNIVYLLLSYGCCFSHRDIASLFIPLLRCFCIYLCRHLEIAKQSHDFFLFSLFLSYVHPFSKKKPSNLNFLLLRIKLNLTSKNWTYSRVFEHLSTNFTVIRQNLRPT